MGYKLMTRHNTESAEKDNCTCLVCGNFAAYWSQKENEDGWTADGLAFNHCQRHRKEGRAAAEASTREDIEKKRAKLLARW